MLVTDLALRDMEQEAQSLFGSLGRLLGRLRGQHSDSVHRPLSSAVVNGAGSAAILAFPSTAHAAPPQGHSVAREADRSARAGSGTSPASPFKWRRHPQLRDRSRRMDDRTAEDRQRDANAAAIRGLFLARSERLGEARTAFAQAAAHPSIDLSEFPGFWQLSRSAMLIAAVAYEDVNRFRDASALSARIRTRFRPRAVAPLVSTSRREASGGA